MESDAEERERGDIMEWVGQWEETEAGEGSDITLASKLEQWTKMTDWRIGSFFA